MDRDPLQGMKDIQRNREEADRVLDGTMTGPGALAILAAEVRTLRTSEQMLLQTCAEWRDECEALKAQNAELASRPVAVNRRSMWLAIGISLLLAVLFATLVELTMNEPDRKRPATWAPVR